MRALLLVLLLVNLAFFAWAQWLSPKEASLPVSPKVDAPRLQLASEATEVADRTGNRCVTVGPFPTTELAARARATLTDSGYSSVPREEQMRDVAGFWVFLEAPSTDAAEKRLLDRLKRGGINDAQAVALDDGGRRISLGIFSEEARAFAQSERVAKLQMLPQIEAREKDTTAIWLDLELKSDAPPLEGQKFKAGESELEFRPCPTPESGENAGEEDESGAAEGEERPA